MIIILAFLTKHCLQASPPPSYVASSLTPFCPFHSLSCPPGSRVGGLWWRCWVQSEVLLKNGFQNSRYVPSSSLSPSARRWRDVPLEAVFLFLERPAHCGWNSCDEGSFVHLSSLTFELDFGNEFSEGSKKRVTNGLQVGSRVLVCVQVEISQNKPSTFCFDPKWQMDISAQQMGSF